jgi:cation transport regulator
MPYKNCSELPKAVREHLPDQAQRIYMKAFNSAWKQYADPRKRREDASRDETAHRVAWAAVEHVYEKSSDGQWYRKPGSA